MDTTEKWAAVDKERARVADLLDDLSEVEWTHPSLCENWRVLDVAAHLTAGPHMSVLAALKAFVKARGNFNRMVYATAKDLAATKTRAELVGLIRQSVGSRRLAPSQSLDNALMDVHVHAQDIAIPLGRHLPMPVEAAVASADHLWEIGFPFHARRKWSGRRLIATDAEWSAGEGAEISGPIEALVMLLAGRTATVPRLSGITP
ncbi:maleylpyruvate isomerase family mycothiol-dependent enzyme [Amycolatopsis alkalitolerans]|uniref:Maleylpyruvate isomerase family mycothiol-dependent enzyme n=1 Tax=Amycolatopsis alkalitolerans TaxID=2547244 RepID=A0A5C4M5A8_9PSEU|nr:maleylpyruvate isomerase family mycothiol-dependent enzyme [Amycolatopsis alkalitolerans]TNC28445.1 maleylpyruvate isomerase family mycothiol-dependent enzyme [Amycolatopsis alkalitolerans]